MEESKILPECSDDDVVSFRGKLFKVGELRKLMGRALCEHNQLNHTLSTALRHRGLELAINDTKQFLEKGVKGELLKIDGKGWQKGKIKMTISLEFVPDTGDEPDRIRRMRGEDPPPLSPNNNNSAIPLSKVNASRHRYPY